MMITVRASLFCCMLMPISLTGLAHAAGQDVLIDGPEVDLTVEDMQKVFAAMPEEVRAQTLKMPANIRKVMDQTYMTKVAAHRAEKKRLDADPVVQAKIWNYRRNVLAEAELQAIVDRSMVTDQDLEEAAKELYLSRKEEYTRPEQVLARHILLKGKKGVSDEELREEIEKIRKEILAGKLTFEEAAKKYSQDKGTASKGGNLGVFPRNRMVKPFSDAAFSLKEGEISEPVKTRYGYHLIRVDKKFSKTAVPFEQVKEKLVQELKKQTIARMKTEYWLQIRDDPAVRLNEELIDALVKKPQEVIGQQNLTGSP